MMQQLIQSMVSFIDNYMVAGLGDVAMSGVNVANQVLFVFMDVVKAVVFHLWLRRERWLNNLAAENRI